MLFRSSIESRATKAGDNGIDITAVTAKIIKAKEVISSTREAIATQSKKVYEIGTVTDEASLKTAMKNLRDTFTKDIKALREVVKGAHMAVKDAATTLAQIPKVDEVEEAEEQKTVWRNYFLESRDVRSFPSIKSALFKNVVLDIADPFKSFWMELDASKGRICL